MTEHVDARLHNITDVMDRLNLGRNTVYDLINTGRLRSFKVQGRRLVSEQAIRDFISKMDREEHEKRNSPDARISQSGDAGLARGNGA